MANSMKAFNPFVPNVNIDTTRYILKPLIQPEIVSGDPKGRFGRDRVTFKLLY